MRASDSRSEDVDGDGEGTQMVAVGPASGEHSPSTSASIITKPKSAWGASKGTAEVTPADSALAGSSGGDVDDRADGSETPPRRGAFMSLFNLRPSISGPSFSVDLTNGAATRYENNGSGAKISVARPPPDRASVHDPGSMPTEFEPHLFGPASGEIREPDETVRFHAGVFVYELLTHMLAPISLPVVLAVDGLVGAQNKIMLPRAEGSHLAAFLFQQYMLALQIVPVVIAAVYAPWLRNMAAMCIAFTVFRYVTIAGKYASFPKAEYDRKMTEPGYTVTADLLATSWFTVVDEAVRERELAAAEAFTGTHLGQLPLLVLQNGHTVCPRRYMALLAARVYGTPPPMALIVLGRILGYITVLFPLLAYCHHVGWKEAFTQPPPSNWDLTAALLLAAQQFVLGATVFVFMVIGVLHYYRAYVMQTALLNAAVRTRDGVCEREALAGCTIDAGMLPLHEGANLLAWDRMRYVARHFGRVYSHRISFNTVATVLVTVFAFARVAFERIVLDEHPLRNREQLWVSVFVLYCFAVASAMGLLAIIFAVLANRADVLASELLTHEELSLFFAQGGRAPARDPSFDAQAQYYRLKAMRAAVELRQRVEPIEVMYLPARPRLVTAFGAFIASAVTVIIALGLSSRPS